MIFWVVAAISVVLVLVGVAGWLHWQLHKKNLAKQAKEKEQHEALLQRRQYAHKSIKILANAVLEDQVTLTEASIRISGLARTFPLTDQEKHFHSDFFALAEKTAHIPYLEKWKELDDKQQKKYTKERISIEARFFDEIRSACQKIGEDSHYLAAYLK